MFKNNKYTKWYFSLMESRKNTKLINGEFHHIIPKCLGGEDSQENLIHLSYREHYLAHLLLIRMHNSKKLINALWQMSFKNKRKYFNSRLYSISKQKYIESIKGNNHWSKLDDFKKSVSNSWNEKRKINFSKKVSGNNHWTKKRDMHGFSEKMRKFIDRNKVNEISKHRFLSNNPMKDPKISSKFKKPKEVVECPYCHKTGGKPVMMRYHFNKCKFVRLINDIR